MDYRPCELCAALVSPLVEPAAGESTLCETCLRTRRVRPDAGPAGDEAPTPPPRYKKHIYKFRCLFCGRKLRSKPVNRAIRLACPACNGQLVIGPNGTVEKHVATGGSSDAIAPVARLSETEDPEL